VLELSTEKMSAVFARDYVADFEVFTRLFYIEGAISFGIGLVSYWLLPDNPETAYFLTKEERQLGVRA